MIEPGYAKAPNKKCVELSNINLAGNAQLAEVVSAVVHACSTQTLHCCISAAEQVLVPLFEKLYPLAALLYEVD